VLDGDRPRRQPGGEGGLVDGFRVRGQGAGRDHVTGLRGPGHPAQRRLAAAVDENHAAGDAYGQVVEDPSENGILNGRPGADLDGPVPGVVLLAEGGAVRRVGAVGRELCLRRVTVDGAAVLVRGHSVLL